LSANGSIVAIGAPGNGDNGNSSGHVRVYENIAGTWTQIGSDIDGEAMNDQSGYSVDLSSNGSIVAIGAIGNGGASGHVRIYENLSGIWTQIGGDIDGENTLDQSGFSVSLSSNGSIVAIGASQNNGVSGIRVGHTRIYDLNANLSLNNFALNNLSTYPSPFKDIINIESSKNLEIEKITVYGLNGKTVFANETNSKTIDLEFLSSGIYILKLDANDSVATFKLIKE
jgi:hypothetical protein